MNRSADDCQVVCFGESCWANLPEGPEAGGAPVNIARHLKMLGLNPAVITRAGIDDTGRRLISFMEGAQISVDFFQIDYDAPTGKKNAGLGTGYRPENGETQAWDNIVWEPAFEQLAENTDYFVHGTLPARSPVSRKTLFEWLEMPIRRVFDMNLCPPHYSKELLTHCLTGCFMVKLTIEELELITGWFSTYNLVDRMRIVQDLFRIPHVLVTSGMRGCWWNANGEDYEHRGFRENELDDEGTDSAFLAALLVKYNETEDSSAALAYASALRAWVASSFGACPSYTLHQINNIIQQ